MKFKNNNNSQSQETNETLAYLCFILLFLFFLPLITDFICIVGYCLFLTRMSAIKVGLFSQ